MLIVRPSQPADLAAIELIARQSPPGVTSLRAPRQLLAEHIDASCAALEEWVTSPGDQRYLLVLQDSHSLQVIGVAGMVAAAGLVEPFYNYRRETLVHASRPLGIHHQVEVLSLCHDLTGHSLLHAFSILTPHLDLQSADLLCRARLLFAAALQPTLEPAGSGHHGTVWAVVTEQPFNQAVLPHASPLVLNGP